jgi:4-hydroxyphenylpyruvate dioxygenase
VFYGIQKPITSDINKIAGNLRRLGLLAQQYNLVVAYEAIAWGTHTNRWQQVRDILALTNLPNVRYCLDTFHIAAKETGDPFNASAPVRPDGLRRLKESLDEMKRSIKPREIAYLQLSDATVADVEQKTYPHPDKDQPPFMTQSRNCRIFPCEPQYGGTLPALDVAKTVFDLNYRGWVSMEVFHTDLWKKDRS